MDNSYLKKKKIPNSPGVYLFKLNKEILYIGKATSLKDRVKSYFGKDLVGTRGPLLVEMVFKAKSLDFIKTDSVLEALILEANLIKKYQPRYNTKEKDNKSFNYIVVTKEDFPRVLIIRERNLSEETNKNYFGPFPNSSQLKEALKIIRKIFPFRDKCIPGKGKPCFNKQIKLCPGVCDNTISKKDYLKIIKNIVLFFEGKKIQILKNLEKEMKVLAKTREYEKAGEVKKKIFALNHIQDIALIKSESPLTRGLGVFRIEAYDASHLSGTNNVGVMVVMEDGPASTQGGEFKKEDYRKFIIKESKGSDIDALKEILERRLKHNEWPYPNLIVLDGGIAQINIAKEILTGKGQNIVAVIKDEKHKAKAIIGVEEIVSKYKKEILAINNEAHRFAISFHRQKRRRSAII